ncbi:MAG TPA: PTS sugar transporter subunit IIA, partial [Syntrophales bacterium]|nr:PTS sugar transporter subunit IIA [Syntrophales bacterium]
MKIIELLRKEFIIPRLEAKTKRGVLEELSRRVIEFQDLDIDEMVGNLLAREKLGSTGIGDGVAIPHAKLSGLGKMILSVGRSPAGVPFEAMDGRPVHIFFVLFAPENSTSAHLKTLAGISRMLKSSRVRENLIAADSAEK